MISGLIMLGKVEGQIQLCLWSNKNRWSIILRKREVAIKISMKQAFEREVLEQIWLIYGRDTVE